MAPSGWTRNVLVGAVALVAGLAGVLPVTAPAAAEGPNAVNLVWPSVTAFNPTTTPYALDVVDAGGFHLVHGWVPESWSEGSLPAVVPVPVSGVVTPPADSDTFGTVRIYGCQAPTTDPGQGCVEVSRSPRLEVRSALSVAGDQFWSDGRFGTGERAVRLSVGAYSDKLSRLFGTWELQDSQGRQITPRVDGTFGLNDVTHHPFWSAADVRLSVPSTVTSGTYRVALDIRADTDDFGELRAAVSPATVALVVDKIAPRVSVRSTLNAFHPEVDGYQDLIRFQVTASEYVSGHVDFLDSAGRRVRRYPNVAFSPEFEENETSWAGTDQSNRLVPAGRYTVQMTLKDAAGLTAVTRTPVTLSRKKLRWVTTTRKVSARASAVGKNLVGSCSRVKRSGAPKGSVRLLSNSRCARGGESSLAGQEFAMVLPEAYRGAYEWMKVSVKGRPLAKRHAAALMHVDPSTQEMHSMKELKGKGVRRGPKVWLTTANVKGRATQKPSVHWIVATIDGNRYRVDSFTVKVRHRVLR